MNGTLKGLSDLFERDLDRLTRELNAYSEEADLWILRGDINNTSGNLALHICGNLKHFVGAIMGNTGYVRQRDLEFSLKDVPRAELIQNIEETKQAVSQSLAGMSPSRLEEDYPLEVFGKPMSCAYFLIHLSGHLNYHLGQINYHRRLTINNRI